MHNTPLVRPCLTWNSFSKWSLFCPFTTSKTAWRFAPNELLSFHGVVLFGGFLWQQSCHLQSSHLKTIQQTVTPALGVSAPSSGHHRELHFHAPTFPQIHTDTHKNNNETYFKYFDIYNMWLKISSGIQ